MMPSHNGQVQLFVDSQGLSGRSALCDSHTMLLSFGL